MMISSVNVNTNLVQRGETKDISCYTVSRQMDNWKLPHVKSSLNVWGIALWQQTISKEVTGRTLWSIKYSRPVVFLRIHFCENKRKRCLDRIPSSSSMFLCEQQKGERLKEADTYTASTRYWLRDVTYHNLDTHENGQCLIEKQNSSLVWLQTYLKCRVVPNFTELNQTLMDKCTTFSASRLFHRFLMSARSGSTRYHKALPNKISSDRTSYYLDGLMHWVFAQKLKRIST